MKPQKRAVLFGVVAGWLVTALSGCGDDGAPAPRKSATDAPLASNCKMLDATEPEVARSLQGATLTALGPATERQVDGKKVSSQDFRVEPSSPARALSGEPVSALSGGAGTVTCSAACTGKLCDPPKGCDADRGGCTPLTCRPFEFCTGTCTKTTVYTPPDAGTSDAGTSDGGTSDGGTSAPH